MMFKALFIEILKRCDREAEVYENLKSSPDHCPTCVIEAGGHSAMG
jgi:hypothetical protein